MSVQHRSPGDPLKIKASEWNSIARVVNSAVSQGMSQIRGGVKVATCLVPKSVVAHRGIAIDPTPIASDLSPSKVIYKYNATPNNPAVQSLIGVVLTTPDQYSGDLVPVQVAVGGQVESRITIPAETTPLFARFGGNGSELIASATPTRIRIVWTEGGVGSFKKALLDIDFGLPLLAQSFATFETAMQTPNIDSITPSGASGLSYATNLSNTACQLERMGLAVDIGTRTPCTYSQTSSDGCTTETATFEMSGEHALAVDGGLRVLLADEQRGSSQEYTDPETGITSNGGPDKLVGGGLRVTFEDPIPAISGITTPGLSIRLRDEIVGEPNQYYPDVLRHNANGLYIANEAESSFQGLDVMLTTNCNFGTMMPGKGLAVATSEITDTAEDGTQTTTIIPNYGIVDVQVCECTCLKINDANEIEFTGNINYEGGIAINVDERTINLQVCQGNGLIVNADNQLQYTGSGGGSSISPCQCSGQWLNNGVFGVKVAGRGECYYNQTNALIYTSGCYYDEDGTKIGTATDVLSVLVDPLRGLTLNTAYKSIQVKPDNTTIGFNGSGELTALTGISSVVQASGVPEEGQNGWVTTMYHPMLYHCGTDAIISYRQLMRVNGGKLEVSHQRAFMGGGWEEYFGA